MSEIVNDYADDSEHKDCFKKLCPTCESRVRRAVVLQEAREQAAKERWMRRGAMYEKYGKYFDTEMAEKTLDMWALQQLMIEGRVEAADLDLCAEMVKDVRLEQ